LLGDEKEQERGITKCPRKLLNMIKFIFLTLWLYIYIETYTVHDSLLNVNYHFNKVVIIKSSYLWFPGHNNELFKIYMYKPKG
jgi:hypothetical protein